MAIHRALAQLLAENPYPEPPVISDLLRDTIVQFDQEIGDALLALFPNADALAEMSQAHITSIIDDPANADTLLRCMRGTTVLVALTDPSRSNIWVASLGDCIAGMLPLAFNDLHLTRQSFGDETARWELDLPAAQRLPQRRQPCRGTTGERASPKRTISGAGRPRVGCYCRHQR